MNDRARSTSVERAVLIAAIAGSAMAFIDGSAVNVALPVLQHDLHATAIDLQWVVEGYALFLAALMLLGGAFGDRFGERDTFVAGIVLFACASIACGLAPTPLALIISRCIQGCGAAIFVPGSLALINAHFSGVARGHAIGTWSGASAMTTALGPVLGGWLVQSVSWRAVFFINVPLALIVVVTSLCFIPRPATRSRVPIDAPGAALVTLALALLTFGLIHLQQRSAHASSGMLVAGGLVMLVAFFVYEQRWSAHPMFPPEVARSRPFVGANIYTLLLYAALGGSLYFVPFEMINVRGDSPLVAGTAMLPFVAILTLSSRWSGALVERIGARRPLVAGAAIAAAGFALFARIGSGSYVTTVFLASAVLGCGAALFVAPLTTVVMGAVEVSRSGIASAVNNAASRVAGLIAVAALALVLAHGFDAALGDARAHGELSGTVARFVDTHRDRLLSGSIDTRSLSSRDAELVRDTIREAYNRGFVDTMLSAAAVSALAALFALRWRWSR